MAASSAVVVADDQLALPGQQIQVAAHLVEIQPQDLGVGRHVDGEGPQAALFRPHPPRNFSPGLSTRSTFARWKETVKVKGTDLTGDLWITGGIAPCKPRRW